MSPVKHKAQFPLYVCMIPNTDEDNPEKPAHWQITLSSLCLPAAHIAFPETHPKTGAAKLGKLSYRLTSQWARGSAKVSERSTPPPQCPKSAVPPTRLQPTSFRAPRRYLLACLQTAGRHLKLRNPLLEAFLPDAQPSARHRSSPPYPRTPLRLSCSPLFPALLFPSLSCSSFFFLPSLIF